jgi:tetratricopeptide (TPR) repeat protein
MTFDEYETALRERLERIDSELEGAGATWNAEQRGAVKREIVELFREVEAAVATLATFKEQIRELVDRYKTLAAAAPAESEPRGLAPSQPTRADHLGSSTYIERGWSAIAAGDYPRAVDELTRALELAPNDPKAEGLLGWAQMLLERYDDALFAFQKVLVREPDNAMARVNLGYICLKKQIFGEAIEHLSRALRLDNDRKATLYANFYLGLVYLEREMYTDARSFFARALEAGPNLIEAYWQLGRTYYLEGDTSGAGQAWRQGWETNRFSVWGERCGEAVSRLESGQEVSFD